MNSVVPVCPSTADVLIFQADFYAYVIWVLCRKYMMLLQWLLCDSQGVPSLGGPRFVFRTLLPLESAALVILQLPHSLVSSFHH